MRLFARAAGIAALLFASGIIGHRGLRAQTKTILPFDHIHLNEPAAEASAWWEKNIRA
jgi:hypothetical protein